MYRGFDRFMNSYIWRVGDDSIGCALHVQMTMLNNGMIRVMCVKYIVALLMALKAKVPEYFQKLT